jgi:parallel beta-helix repeat protein
MAAALMTREYGLQSNKDVHMGSWLTGRFWLTGWLPLPIHKLPARRLAANLTMPAAELLEERQLLSATVWVDPSSNVSGVFHTIQGAVDAANSGDTIKVVPGTYDESVTVNKTVMILGGQSHRAGQKGASIVQSDTAAFTLSSDDIVLKGFTIDSLTTPANGIVTDADHSGDVIENDLIEHETTGLDLNSPANAGALLTNVSHNQFVNNVDDIISDEGLWTALIGNNQFTDSTDAAIDLKGSSEAYVRIVNNRTSNAGPILLANTANAEVELNVIIDPDGDGIVLAGGVTTTQVSNNTLRGDHVPNNDSPHSVNGIELNSSVADAANSEDQISANSVRGFVDGILLTSAHSDTVSNNETDLNTGIGIAAGAGTHDDTFNRNTAQNNSLAGFSLDGDEETIENNISHNNGADGFDLSGDQDTITSNKATTDKGNGFLLSGDDANASKNAANNNAGDGFLLSDLTGGQFNGNTALHDGGDGIHLVNAPNNMVLSNVVQNGGSNGIELDDESVGNLLEKNISQYSRHNDLADASTGAGTAGTANFWSQNISQKHNPAEL